jgi:glycosyltransferase 2 family protein
LSAGRKIWKTSWRIAVGLLLLLWIVHSIFVNEARQRAGQGQLFDNGKQVVWTAAQQPPRLEQWRLGWSYGPPALWQTLRSVHPGALALSLLLMAGTLLIGITRWRMVLKVHGLALPFSRAAEISLVAHFFNSFLLGTAGGDVMKAYYAARETHHKKTEAVMTVFVDRVIGLWAMLLFASIMILPNFHLFERSGLRRVAAAVVFMAMAASVFAFIAFRGGVSRRWTGARVWLRKLPKGEWLERSLDNCREFGKQRGFVSRALALSMLLNFVCVLQFWVLARGLSMSVSLLALCLVVPTVICIAAVPIAPAGLGVRENLFVQMLASSAIGADPTDALSLSLLAFAGSLFWGLIGGVVYMMFKQKHHLAEKELASADPIAD